MRTGALLISAFFHPLLMSTYVCLLLFFGIENTVYDFMTEPDTKWRITIIVFVFSFIFPIINVYIMYRLKRIPDILLTDRNDRTFPYLMTSLFYFGLFYLLSDINIWPSFKLFIVGAGIAILLTALINLKFKISAHMVGIGGVLGILLSVSYLIKFDMTFFYIIVILLAGLIGFARLVLNEHKPYQLYLGFLLGLCVQSLLFFVMQKFTFA